MQLIVVFIFEGHFDIKMETALLVPSNLTFSDCFMMIEFCTSTGCGISKDIAFKRDRSFQLV